MKKFLIIVVVLVGIGAAVVHFTGNTEKLKEKVSGAKDKSQGYKKEIADEHKKDVTMYETSRDKVDRLAVTLRNSLKQGEEATEKKAELAAALKTFAAANSKMNKLGYLFEDQYTFNLKRITELEAITK